MASIEARTLRVASTVSRMSDIRDGVSSRLPSRNWLSRLSASWVIRSSVENAKKPQVPLMVWIVRKMLASNAASCGRFSSSTSS